MDIPAAAHYVRSLRKWIQLSEPFVVYSRRGLRISAAVGAPVPGEWIEPKKVTPRCTMLYLHGGGFLMCSPRTHRSLTTFFARNLPARVLVPDYRLAPEHPFPAAVDDAVASYRWLLAQGISPKEIVVAGDSAGGTLVMSLLLKLREAGDLLPVAAVAMSPWLDMAGTGDSWKENSLSDAWFYRESMPIATQMYLGETPTTHPIASPLYAELAGLPPIILHASSSEVVRDDSVRFAQKAKAVGVEAEIKIWPEQSHVWQAFIPFVPEARESLEEILAFLKKHLPQA